MAGTGGTSEVTSSISKGYEIGGVFNPTKAWRISANAAQQEASRGETSPTSCAREERLQQWKNPALWPLTLSGGVQRVIRMHAIYDQPADHRETIGRRAGCRNCGSGARTC